VRFRGSSDDQGMLYAHNCVHVIEVWVWRMLTLVDLPETKFDYI
jgi:hypothetical protein